MVVTIDPTHWCELGLEFVGLDTRRQKCHKTNLERFVTHFGASPETHSLIFNDLQRTDIPEAERNTFMHDTHTRHYAQPLSVPQRHCHRFCRCY